MAACNPARKNEGSPMNPKFLNSQPVSPHTEHGSVDFTVFDKKAIEKKSKLLRAQAETRGWLFSEAVA